MFLSIIIPVYNGTATISRCLDSIYSQGMEESDFEVICVDDCSPDPSSVSAIENYKSKNCTPSNLVLIKHEINKRQGGARNTGVRAAKGEWLMFVDCDDYLLPDSLKQLQAIALSHPDLELIHFCYLTRTEAQVLERSNEGRQASQIMTGSEYHIKQPSPSKATEALFKKSCFLNNNLWFEENIRFEDLDFVIKFLVLANKVIFVPILAYCYIIHKGSTTDIGPDRTKMKELLFMCNRLAYAALDFNKEYPRNSEIMLGHAGVARVSFLKRDLWKLPFRERLSVLHVVKLPFKTGKKFADFTSEYPFATNILLCFLNQPIINQMIKLKNTLRTWKIIK